MTDGNNNNNGRKVYGMDPHPDFVDIAMPRSFYLSESFHLTPLSPEHVLEDYEAVRSSAPILKGTFGNEWPEGLTPEENRIDLCWHEREFTLQRSFSWIVRSRRRTSSTTSNDHDNDDMLSRLPPEEEKYLGCAYVFPEQGRRGFAKVVTWIRADGNGHDDDDEKNNRTSLLTQLNEELKVWLEDKLGDKNITLEW